MAPAHRRLTAPYRTLQAAFDPHANSLNTLRILLAATVIVSHAWPTGGFGEDPKIGGEGAGRWAVAGFFAISGFLVTGSRTQLGLGDYLARRAARILPGFWACLAATAFLFAPIVAWFSGTRYDPITALNYVGRNLGLVIVQPTVGSTLAALPFEEAWNGSLWTLKWEFLAYLAVGVAWAVPALRRRRWVFLAAFVALTAAHLAVQLVAGPNKTVETDALWLSTDFAAGVVLYLFRDRIRIDGRLALLAVVAVVAADAAGVLSVFGPMPIAYLMMWLAVELPARRAFTRNDISYGLYIYGFLVQQCLALAGVPRLGVAWMAVLGIVGTVPLAYLSWVLVERPARDVVRRALRGRTAGTSSAAPVRPGQYAQRN